MNYRSWSDLDRLLVALREFPQYQVEFEVLVVDNNSDDGALEAFSECHPTVRFIPAPRNGGFAYGCNLGAERARADLFLFLNPDTVPTEASIEDLTTWYRKHSPAILSCRQTESAYASPLLFPSLSTLTGLQRALYRRSHTAEQLAKGCIEGIARPDWVSGSVLMISREWFESVGGWDQRYWMYSEDADLCKRVHDAGGAIQLLCNTYLPHEHGGTTRSDVSIEALTKSEVVASKHVYVQQHFMGWKRMAAQSVLCISTLLGKGLAGILTLPLFPVRRLRVHPLLLLRVLRYYARALVRRTWISERAVRST